MEDLGIMTRGIRKTGNRLQLGKEGRVIDKLLSGFLKKKNIEKHDIL